ncbi:MAG: hypothetical protein AABX82_02835 [Nanoarchaeota archaeon]
MNLEDILKTTKTVARTAKQDLWDRPDEWVRKQYQKVGDKIPERVLYPCTTLLGLFLGLPEMGWMSHFPNTVYTIYAIPITAGFLHFEVLIKQDTLYNLNGLLGRVSHPSYSMSNSALDKRTVRWNSYNSYIRFPTLVASAFFSAVALYSLKEGVGRPFIDTLTAEGFFAIASSMYLKDRDPKQFEKKPFWERAYDAVTERIREYLPHPTPGAIPIPARSYLSAETAASL